MKKELFEGNLILKLTLQFSLRVVEYCERLEAERKYVIARQLLKSGSSIGANVMEAQDPESKADFIHKIKIATKEAGETQYWLMLCDMAPTYPTPQEMLMELESIQKVLAKILSTSKRKTPISFMLSYLIL